MKNILVYDHSFWLFWPFFWFLRFSNSKLAISGALVIPFIQIRVYLESLGQAASIGTLGFPIGAWRRPILAQSVENIQNQSRLKKFSIFQKFFFSISRVNTSPQHIKISAKKVEKWPSYGHFCPKNFRNFEFPKKGPFYKIGPGDQTAGPKIEIFGIWTCPRVGVRLGIVGGLGPGTPISHPGVSTIWSAT